MRGPLASGAATRRTAPFGHLTIGYDHRVLVPRSWTAEQSRWAASLLPDCPAGDVLELCCGAGQIGLLAIALQPRPLVMVDADPVACAFAARNAEDAGLSGLVEVRNADLATAVPSHERFALVIADPPWVPSSGVDRFPEDPRTAIDGGADGLDLARACLRVAGRHTLPGGVVLLQVGPGQLAAVGDAAAACGLRVTDARHFGERGSLVRLDAPATS
jgi:methylase of polypeptide subunit release factors